MKRRKSEMLDTNQKSLSGFLGDQEKDEKDEEIKIEKDEKDESKIISVRKSNQFETDYYDKSRVDTCAKLTRERFNVHIEILPVTYGKNPKIFGYYMLITIKSGDMDRIKEFIKNECHLKVY